MFAQQTIAEYDRIDSGAVCREKVECSFGRNKTELWNLPQQFLGKVSPSLELLPESECVLTHMSQGVGGGLLDEWRETAHGVLDESVNHSDGVLLCDDVAGAPSGHRETLGQTEEGNHNLGLFFHGPY